MKKVNKLAPNQTATRMPVLLTCICYLMLEVKQPEGWVHGVVWTLIAIIWIAYIINFFKEDWVYPYNDGE